MRTVDELMDKEDPDIKVDIATMDHDGSIMIIDKGALESGQPTLATQDVSKKDPDYIEYCKSFQLITIRIRAREESINGADSRRRTNYLE